MKIKIEFVQVQEHIHTDAALRVLSNARKYRIA
jgi:hypothetical protein